MDKLVFGTAGIPISTKPRNHPNGVKQIHDLNLGCMEMELSRQARMNPDVIKKMNEYSRKYNVILSAHGPYYINLNALESDKISASIDRTLATARITQACGGYSITFHAGYYMNMDKEYVYNKIRTNFETIINTLKEENIKIWVRPETTGKVSQWGELDEVIRLSRDVEMVLPCVDFSHLHARYQGEYNTYDKFAYTLDKIGKEIGEYALKNFHAHIAGIQYGYKGEKGHTCLKESELNYKKILKALKNFQVTGIIICESPNLEDDALLLQKEYKSFF